MKNTRSISTRLKHVKSSEEADLVIVEWLKAWNDDQLRYIKRLEYAISNDSYDDLCIATGGLKRLTTRKFRGLETILKYQCRNPTA